ncbi:MAG: stage II sporulation protein R [Clostridia bacterium]|nr:stage II sporulation protein R [Clostridia bacterium]
MNTESFVKRYVSFVLAAFLLAYSSAAYMPSDKDAEIYSGVLRLHVVANSDSEYDQAQKLSVRDAVLCELDKLYKEKSVQTLDGAKAVINANMDKLTAAARSVVGDDIPLKLTLGRESFPRKSYDGVTLPAGKYESLIIRIGKAEGKNWWCVLFPTLCLSHATKSDKASVTTYVYTEDGEKFIAAGFTPDQIRLITENDSDEIKVKFRILEIFGSVFDRDE